MEFLNYHHLRYFWFVAREGNLRKAAEKLHISQSTISAQIAELEGMLGEQLFRRAARGLSLTEAGQQIFLYAEDIFLLGEELLNAIKQRPAARSLRVQIGIADSLPKLISHQLMKPIFQLDQPVQPVCQEGKVADLLAQLAIYRLDIVLADEPSPSSLNIRAFNHLLGECGVSFCGEPKLAGTLKGRFPKSLDGAPILLPTSSTALRQSLERWFQAIQVRPRLIAEYDDAALMAVAAADGLGFMPIPTLAINNAVKHHGFKVIGKTDACREQIYAITAERRITHPAVVAITSNAKESLFGKSCRLKQPS